MSVPLLETEIGHTERHRKEGHVKTHGDGEQHGDNSQWHCSTCLKVARSLDLESSHHKKSIILVTF